MVGYSIARRLSFGILKKSRAWSAKFTQTRHWRGFPGEKGRNGKRGADFENIACLAIFSFVRVLPSSAKQLSAADSTIDSVTDGM